MVSRTQDAHASPGVEYHKVVVAAHDGFCSGRESKLQILVVLWVATIAYRHPRLEPDSRAPQDLQEVFKPFTRDGTSESRAAQHLGNLGINCGREREHV